MDQVVARFPDAATRDASFGGLGEPTLSEGRLAYLDSDNKVYVYNGSSWVEVGISLSGTSGQIVVFSSGGSPTSVNMSGDVTITNTGATTIGSGAVTQTKLGTGTPQAGFRSVQNPQTGTTYTLVLTDLSKLVELNNASSITLTVPSNSSVAFAVGDRIDLLQTGAGQVTVAGSGGVTVNGTPGLKLRTQWSAATLIKRATDTWVLVGDLSA
jgi:hypothetical protein